MAEHRFANPDVSDLRHAARHLDLDLSDEELELLLNPLAVFLAPLGRVDDLTESDFLPRIQRDRGQAPLAADNPFNAWCWRCAIRGDGTGPLEGKRLVVKDNIAVAGTPMTTVHAALAGYVPSFDATVVRRCLDAGGEILGKSTVSSTFHGGNDVRNPNDPSRTAGASSGGSAALVAAGECDIALGGDQGGSIRVPSAWCGVYGLKPTFGLVPYTGVVPIDRTLDHVGPIARSVSDLAACLEAVAGDDGLDERQTGAHTEPYREALAKSISGVRVGLLAEGFGWPDGDPAVDSAVRHTLTRLSSIGAHVRDVSAPLHRDGVHINSAIAFEAPTLGLHALFNGTNWKGLYWTELADQRERSDFKGSLPRTRVLRALAQEYARERYQGRYYAKAQNLGRALSRAYDDVFREVDVLAMPTVPRMPRKIDEQVPLDVELARWRTIFANTAPFNVTGHPALTVPCARRGTLPVGMMLVAPLWSDAKLLTVAHALEQAGISDTRPVVASASRKE